MRKGVYSTANLRRMRLMPFGYRCGACGALNAGFYPLSVTTTAKEQAEEDLNKDGRELTEAERAALDRRQTGEALDALREQMASRKWNGSPNCVALCGSCGQRAPWSRPGMRAWDWFVSLLIPLGFGVYELAYEGLYYHEPRAILLGSILVAMSAVLMVIAAVSMSVRKRRIDALPPESHPNIFGGVGELEAYLAEQRRPGDILCRAIDPRSPEADFLKNENADARRTADAENWALCGNCLRILRPDITRIYEDRKYCADCYGLVRQENENRSWLNARKKRGGDIR